MKKLLFKSLVAIAMSAFILNKAQASSARVAQTARQAASRVTANASAIFKSTAQQCQTQGFCTWKQGSKLKQLAPKLPKAEIQAELTKATKSSNLDVADILTGVLIGATAGTTVGLTVGTAIKAHSDEAAKQVDRQSDEARLYQDELQAYIRRVGRGEKTTKQEDERYCP